jgi:hypothetical protein
MSARMAIRLTATALAATALLAGPAAAAVPVTVSGTIEVVGTLAISSDIPTTATITAQATASFYDNGVSQQASASAEVTRSGGTATVTLTVPYRFTAATLPSQISVSLYVTSSAAFRYASVTVAVATPKNGATTRVALPASL